MSAEPLHFGDAARPLFGWLHRPESAANLGLVLCKPFGYESICSHRPLRYFAQAAAAAGIPALRFDYDGTLDSAGDDRDPDRVASWLKSVHHAADELRRLTGVLRVCFVGVRLGATLAALAAAERSDVEGVIAIAPVVSGKSYVRELRLLQMSLNLAAPPAGAVVDETIQEAVGFFMTSETREAVSKLDLLKLAKSPAPSLLLLDRPEMPGAEKWAERLTALGAQVERKLVAGYVEMVLDAEKSVVPEQLIAASMEWLRPRAQTGTQTGTQTQTRTARLPNGVVESAEYVDRDKILFGIYSTPEKPPRSRHGLLLLNSGAVHHVGPNRLYVALARRWAALGHAVLRFDLAGIGDSRVRPGDPENVVYTPRAPRDIEAAVAWLRRQPGVTEVHAIGVCSGAYNAFKAAVAGLPLDGVACINPVVFFFKPGMSLDIPVFKVTEEAQRYAQRARSLDAWKKLLRGDVHYDVLAKILARRAQSIVIGRVRDAARLVRWPLADDLASELQAIVRNKITLRFVFASQDPGLTILRTDGGTTVERLRKRGRLGIDVIEGPDHTFTPVWSHAPLISTLGKLFDEAPRR